MGNHHQHCAGDADDTHTGDAKEHKAHVRHAGVAQKQGEILLAQGDQAAPEQVAQRQRGEQAGPLLGALWQQWQGDANQHVEAEFLDDTRVHHGRGRRRGGIAQGCPGMERPETHEDAQAKEEQAKNGLLHAQRKARTAFAGVIK